MNVYNKMAEKALIEFQKNTTFNCAFHEKDFMKKLFYKRDSLVKIIEYTFKICERINIEEYEVCQEQGSFIYRYKTIPVQNYDKFVKEVLGYIFNTEVWYTQKDFYNKMDLANHLFIVDNYEIKKIDGVLYSFKPDVGVEPFLGEIKDIFCHFYAEQNKLLDMYFQDLKQFKEGYSVTENASSFEEYLGLLELNYSY